MIRLHMNELRPPATDLWREIWEALRDLDPSTYPTPEEEHEVRAGLAAYAGWDPARVLHASGSDPLIFALLLGVRLHLRRLVMPWPTFPLYAEVAARLGVPVERVPLGPGLTTPLAELRRRASPEDAVLVVRPNNPTGEVCPAEGVRELVGRAGLVILDEAYAELADGSLAPELRDAPGVVVLRTLSKVFGLAGLRLGYLLVSADWHARLAALVPPYPVGRPGLVAARVALRRAAERVPRVVAGIRARRERLLRLLAARPGLAPYPSQANFVLVRVGPPAPPAAELAARLRAEGILVRTLPDDAGLPDHLRVTVGADEDLDALERALDRILAGARDRGGETSPLARSGGGGEGAAP